MNLAPGDEVQSIPLGNWNIFIGLQVSHLGTDKFLVIEFHGDTKG
jgi:hypothetical protein